MNGRFARAVLIVLALVALAEAAVLTSRITDDRNRASMMPLFHEITGRSDDNGGDSSFRLEAPDEVANVIARRVGMVGTPLTMEDVVRGVMRLEQEGDLPADVRRQLAVLLAQAHEVRGDLLACQEEIAATERRIHDLSVQIAGELTAQQRQTILDNRDQAAIGGMEAPYWNALIHALENAPMPAGDRP